MRQAKEEEEASIMPQTKDDQPCSNNDDRGRVNHALWLLERAIMDAEAENVDGFLAQKNQPRKRKRNISKHADDVVLFSSMSTASLNKFILEYTHFNLPPLLHCCLSNVVDIRNSNDGNGDGNEVYRYKGLYEGFVPSPPLSFELIDNHSFIIAGSIAYLQDNFPQRPFLRQQIVQFLLSGVDKSDSGNILDRISPSQNFLRLHEDTLSIYYGQHTYTFLRTVPVYRLGTKRNKHHNNNINGDCRESIACSIKNFWRMVHLDYTHINEALRQNKWGGKNYRKYGIQQKGMTMEECTVRYDYEQGDGKWSHPNFIPGVFIAMAQRYRWSGWKDVRKDKRKDQKEYKHNDKHENGISSGKESETSETRGVPINGVAPTCQILLTDGPNDRTYAHLYTTQVPRFIISSLDEPGQCQFPVPPAKTKDSGVNGHNNEYQHEDLPFDFPIRHTKIAYEPYESFRQRLRESIVCSHESFRDAGKNARGPEHEEGR
ncbi:hypothetical protein E0Z10_g477 [Xylaria hypoxylon]|uniref:Uncharacterized protein n=1 Tax=Xylaria hypoxylon TaxID=37992 RepID=A0A4Z0YW41_9PEZI|nr:hypothetical protein E0Z10_g477 [Xylaria hypoxylon]